LRREARFTARQNPASDPAAYSDRKATDRVGDHGRYSSFRQIRALQRDAMKFSNYFRLNIPTVQYVGQHARRMAAST
jgi:hypothetical protein